MLIDKRAIEGEVNYIIDIKNSGEIARHLRCLIEKGEDKAEGQGINICNTTLSKRKASLET